MSRSYPLLAARVFNTPLLVHPQKGRVIAQALAGRMGLGQIVMAGEALEPMAGDWFDDDEDTGPRRVDPGYDVHEGVAIIEISGTLVHRTRAARTYCGMLGYNAVRNALAGALADTAVRAVVLVCNSPGGEVSGCFDLVDAIHAARGDKPIWAICDDMAFSACYAIASACDRITVPRTGGTGSIGVVTLHADFSQALREDGIDVTIFTHGDRKAMGNPYNPLSRQDRAEIQAEIDALGELFTNTAARNRGMSPADIVAMQARCYMGAAGVDAGLADAVMAPDEAFRSLLAELG